MLAFGANLSLAADSHLVCIQSSNDENAYHTQAINIHNKPRKGKYWICRFFFIHSTY